MNPISIKASDVRVGDRVYDSNGMPGHKWTRVTEVEPCAASVCLQYGGITEVPGVRIHTSGWYMVLTDNEGIAVQRTISA